MSALATQYLVPQQVLDDSRTFFRSRGADNYEGTALWAGCPADAGVVAITRLVVPEQVAETTPFGARVDLTARAHYTLTDLLHPGELFYARIHSHPGRAFHSERDDANQVLSHQGAISIVVPYFARSPIRLPDCAVYKLEHGRGWLPLDPQVVRATFTVVGEAP